MSINVSAVRSTVPLVDGGLNVATGQAVQDTGRNVKAAEFGLTLGIRNGKSFKTKQVWFSAVASGTTEQATPTLEDLINGASVIASNIAAMSRGAVFGFFMKLGKYRNDEKTPNYQSVPKLGATLQYDNNDVELNDCGIPTSGITPLRHVSQKIYIPFLNEDISLATLNQTLSTPVTAGQNITVSLGVTRFDQDGEKDSISAYKTLHKSYGKLGMYDKIATIDYLNVDSAVGDSDNIVSEKYNTVTLVPDTLPTPPDHNVGA